MTGIPSRLLIDTCVWVDSYVGFRPGSAEAAALVYRTGQLGVDIFFSAATAKDVYYLVGKLLKEKAREGGQVLSKGDALAIRSLAWSCVSNMGEIGTMVGMDASDMWLAEKYRGIHDDFEDDLVLAAMRRCGADFLVTNDERLLRDAPVAALNVDDALKLLGT